MLASLRTLVAVTLCALLAVPANAATVNLSKPEEVGFSSERLQRIRAAVQRHIDAKDFGGAVTLVARRGKVVHFEAQGLMDLETKTSMRTDALSFRCAASCMRRASCDPLLLSPTS